MNHPQAGEPARKSGPLGAEVIGPPSCPILHRWTLWPLRGGRKHEQKDVRFKLMVHHFLPNADDRDVHDHPRPFLTLVLKGSYDDMRPCGICQGVGRFWVTSDGFTFHHAQIGQEVECMFCHGEGVVLNERMRPGMLRYRPAEHKHRTKVSARGCWTIVLMGPLQRRWGFWRAGEWFYWRDYERRFGFGMRCD